MAWYPRSADNQYPPAKPPLGTQLNRAHPLAQRLVGCWLFNEGGGVICTDVASGGRGVATSGSYIGPRGFVCAAGGYVGIENYTKFKKTSPVTVIVGLIPTADWGSGDRIIGTDSGAGGWVITTGDGDSFRYTNDLASGDIVNTADSFFGSGGTPVINTKISFAYSWDGGTSAGSSKLHKNGTQTTLTESYTGTAKTDSSTFFRIGGVPAIFEYAFIFDRALSASEIAYLHANPYQMFVQPLMWVNLAASGGTTAVYSDLALRWDCLNIINSDSSLRYDILNAIASDSTLKFDINNIITSDSSLRWDMAGTVSSDLTTRFDILNQIASDLGLRFDILQGVSSDLILKFDLNNMVQSDITALWNMAGGVWSDCTVRYTINQDAGVGYFIIQTDSDKHAKYNRHKNYKRRYKVI